MVRQALVGVLLAGLLACQGPGAGDQTVGRPHRNAPPVVEVAAPTEYVGHGEAVRLEPRVSDPEGRPVTIRWEQLGGPTVEHQVGDRGVLRFRTHELDVLAPPRDGPIQVLALPPSKAGHYRFRCTASDGEAEASAVVEVRAGAAQPGWPRAAQKTTTFLDAGLAQDRYLWEVSFAPPNSEPLLVDAETRRPALVVSRPGRYMVREAVSGRELAVHSGPWMGTEQCGRLECHPREALGWATTKMATVLTRGLDGALRHDYGPDCLRCHTVGYDLGAENDGFDDVATKLGWEFPRRLQPGNAAAMPRLLADRGNVGCEACHGPGRFYTSYSADVCAGCHESPPDYVNPIEWRRAPMSTIRDGILDREECRRCHTAQGFIDEFFGHRPVEQTARVEDAEYTPEPITCGACHDTHNGARERLVRFGGPLWGQEPDVDWGTGMVCLACHHGGTQWYKMGGAVMRPFVPRFKTPPETFTPTLWDKRLTPHAPQAEMVRGRGGYALPGPGPLEAAPTHLTVPGGCVGCHVRVRPPAGDARRGLVGGHTFAMFSGEGGARVENTDACATCHGQLASLNREVRHDYDGDGVRGGIYDEVGGLMKRTKAALDHAIVAAGLTDGRRQAASFGEVDGHVVLIDAEGAVLGEPDAPMTIPADQDRLYRGIYNYMFVQKDRSNGVHNPVWTVRLLQRTILRAAPREVPRWFWR